VEKAAPSFRLACGRQARDKSCLLRHAGRPYHQLRRLDSGSAGKTEGTLVRREPGGEAVVNFAEEFVLLLE